MSNEYCENKLIQESAANILKNTLGWEVVFAFNDEVLGENGTFGRKTYREVLLPKYLEAGLKKVNPWINPKQINEVKQALEEHLSTSSLLEINRDKYAYFLNGVDVTVIDKNGTKNTKKAFLVDFQNVDNNSFVAVQELKINGPVYNRRTDIVGFVNGIPLLFVELKRLSVDIYNAYVDNYRDYIKSIPQLFYYNAIIMFSNGNESKVGTLESKYEFFHEWKRLAEEEAGNVALETALLGICNKKNFLDLLENFILFDNSGSKLTKILARNHQYLGVNKAVEKYAKHEFQDGKLGVFWHTQGSGKSYSMIFFVKKILRKLPGSPTFILLTDRDELNKQLSSTFAACGVLGNINPKHYIAQSGEDLIDKIHANLPFIFTLIHKFNKPNSEPYTPEHDIIIISDEAHRSQYGYLAENMCKLLPTASRIGFTGTPIFGSNDITARTFGEYVSVYDFQRAVEDHATVPLYYDNRGEKLKDITNPKITEEILNAIEEADLDINQQDKLEHEFEKEIHLLTAEPRLKVIAKDFVNHYSYLWQAGKAMFVCLNKVTCVRMYNYVKEYWHYETLRIEQALAHATSEQEALELEHKLKWMQETEMAVVISEEQNEEATFKKWGLDILPHREKMKKRELDKEFKDADNPFRIVFVCAMWLTGFDCKSLSCLYLDKPMKAHTLMQTIARANRVAEGKSNGLILDYIGIIAALNKALAEYTKDIKEGGTTPTVDKNELIKRILQVITEIKAFLKQQGVCLEDIMKADTLQKLSLLISAEDALCATMEIKKRFQVQALELFRLMRFTDKGDLKPEALAQKDAIKALFDQLKEKVRHADNTDLMVKINKIISENVSVELPDDKSVADSKQFDISKIDFDLLRVEFAKAKHKNILMRDLEELVQNRLDAMLLNNPARVDYYKRYNDIIKEYNAEQDKVAIEKTFMELMKLTEDLSEEQHRYVRENLDNDEQLAIYDMLYSDNLSKEDIKAIKTMCKELYAEVKKLIDELDHWAEKENTRAMVSAKISDIIYEKAPEMVFEHQAEYGNQIFEYFYTRYGNAA